MDETDLGRTSEAAATRKRRSSILKNQRAPRTPFSELEFNVATPTDVSKSRRVSFSRRTGVAEFITNEATTTWKNFYEEHNKSLESSGNESVANCARPPLGHIGNRMFELQFQEVEAGDLIGGLGPHNSLNLTQQFVALDTSDGKLIAPQNNFELSALTDLQNKLFGNDFSAPCLTEMSGRIDVNFSTIQTIAGEKDDLDEIQKDLQRQTNVIFHGPDRDSNMSNYIEVDLNTTHVAHNEESDMSITDLVHIPEVQDVSKSCSIDKKIAVNKDWETDKENIAMNPYAAPRESANFALNEDSDKVLVFDGKRLTLQYDKDKNTNNRQTLLPTSVDTPPRKTIFLNVNDDLPNFVDEPLAKVEISGVNEIKPSFVHNSDISMTVKSDIIPKRTTVLDDTGNISITQSLPFNILAENGKRKSVVYDDGNISVTQALPARILTNRRRTVTYENDTGNISVTQCVLIDNNNGRRQTVVLNDDDGDLGNISITQALPTKIIEENTRKRTVVHEDDTGDVSITQDLPANIILPQKKEKRRTVLFEDGNISVTQALPSNIILPKGERKRRTILYEDDSGNISVTQAVSSNMILEDRQESDKTVFYEYGNISKTPAIPSIEVANKIDCDHNTIHVSITRTVPTDIIQDYGNENYEQSSDISMKDNLFTDGLGNISLTQAVSSNIILTEKQSNKRQSIVFTDEDADISMTQALPLTVLLEKLNCITEQESYRNLDENQRPKHDIVCVNALVTKLDANETRRTLLLEDVLSDSHNKESEMLVTESKKAEISFAETKKAEMSFADTKKGQMSFAEIKKAEISVAEVKIPETLVAEAEQPDIHMTEAMETEDKNLGIERHIETIGTENHNLEPEKHKAITFENSTNLSISKPIPVDLETIQIDIAKCDIRKSSVSIQEANQDVFVYQAVTSHSTAKLAAKRTDQGDSKSENPDLASSSDVKSATGTDDVSETTEDVKPSIESIEEETNIDTQNFTNAVVLGDDIKSEMSESKILGSMDVAENDDAYLDCKDSEYKEKKRSVLNALLDMSSPSADGIDDKNLMVKVESEQAVTNAKKLYNSSSESLFYITRESDHESQTETKPQTPKLDNISPPPIEYKGDTVPGLIRRLSELKEACTENKSPPKNRHYEKVLSSDLNITESGENIEKSHVSFKNANDTRELLDMLSHLTDKTSVEEENAEPEPQPIVNKPEKIEPKRLSFAPNRVSIVLSREDLLNNISIAKAALQKSRLDLDDTDVMDDTKESPMEKLQKSVRMSNEVVKTLHFEDESLSESSIKSESISESKSSPLKKTAFGETSYMRESKAKVIPSYLKDVSDGLKELMSDLVKPMADVLPFEAAGLDRCVKKSASTCSTQIQANLITSSQIDIDSELYSNAESCYNISMKSPIKTASNASEKSFEVEMDNVSTRKSPVPQVVPGEVLVFDHNNPLNNINLGPIDYTDAHKYNPNRYVERISEISSDKFTDKEFEIERVSIQCTVGRFSHAMEGDACSDNAVIPSTLSNITKTLSMDQSIDVKLMEGQDKEVNTVIAMKGYKKLLEASSSLTLVDDAVTNAVFEADIDTKTSSQDSVPVENLPNSPVNVIYKVEDQIPEKLTEPTVDTVKPKKRNYSPSNKHKYQHITSIDVTPKPNTKMQKVSNSPNIFKAMLDMNHASEHTLNLLAEGCDITAMDIDKDETKEIKKSPKKNRTKIPTYTVQQAVTDYKENEKVLNVEVPNSDCSSSEPRTQSDIDDCKSLDVISSYASGNKIEMNDVLSVTTTGTGTSAVLTTSRIDWHPELINELNSKYLVTECESSVNVVAKIDMLPFMGSHECEWESSSGDTWSFRLLHARLRLTVRLAHRHNATRTRVREDTCVQDLAVEIAKQDKKNPVAPLCVRFAFETMKHLCACVSRSGAICAGDVPALLRRAAAIARVALRWGRAMQDARLHLAYTLDSNGSLVLKVANIPLRSVWEVTMRVELVVEDACGGPWPRAGDVRVSRVVSDVRLEAGQLRRVLDAVPRDWGHVPRTIWRLFKYLKRKTRDDESLLGMT